MSAHVVDRLSALLDGELTETEASGVRQHLADCEACAACFRELEGVDRAFAAMPAGAPAGYFDSFAARVRSRVEAAPSGGGPVRTHPPARFRLALWSGAVAAAILLGVLLPRLPWDIRPRSQALPAGPADVLPATPAQAPERLAAPPAASQPPATAARADPSLRQTSEAAGTVPAAAGLAPADDPKDTTARDAFAEAGADARVALESQAAVAQPAETAAAAPRLVRPAPAHGAAPTAFTAPDAPRPTPGPPVSAKPQAKKDTEQDLASKIVNEASRAPLADAQLRRREEGLADAEPTEAPSREAALSKSEAEASAPAPGLVAPENVAQGRAQEAKRRPAAAAAPGKEARADGATVDANAAAEYAVLADRRSESIAELRLSREAWRSFLTRHPKGARADEARVSVIAASVEVAVRSRAAADEAEARRDGETYLAREDAAQKGRVQTLLARLPGNR